MFDFSSLAQWLNANKGNISTAVDVARVIYDEATGNDIKKAEAEKRKEEERQRLVKNRAQAEEKYKRIYLRLLIKASQNPNATSSTKVSDAKIDSTVLKTLLEQNGLAVGKFTYLWGLLPMGELEDVANEFSIYICDKKKIRPLTTDI